MNNDADNYMSWIRQRSSFREAYSRESQTTITEDFLDESDNRSRPTTATNVRRASLLLSDLRSIYSSQQQTIEQSPPRIWIRDKPSPSNPWNIYFRDNVLAELDETLKTRDIYDQKCRLYRHKVGKKVLARCFLCWRQRNLRNINRDLEASIETTSSNFYQQRRASVVKVWSHIAIGLNSQKDVIEKRRGGLDLASETIGQRLVRKNEAGAITSDKIEDEIDTILAYNAMDIWLSGYRKITYFRLWRDSLALPTQYYNRRRCRSILSTWKAQSKAAVDVEGWALTIDYTRYEEAKSHHQQRVTGAMLRRWRTRMQTLSRFAGFCLRMWQSTKQIHSESKRNVLLNWSHVVQVNQTFCRAPFQRWREIAFNERQHSRIQNRLVCVYLQSKRRKKLWMSFLQWKRQSQYSRVTSKYGRNELASGWLQQKQRCTRLESALEDMSLQSDELKTKIKRLEEQLQRSEKSRTMVEQELASRKRGAHSTSSSSPFRESLEILCPIFTHSNNML